MFMPLAAAAAAVIVERDSRSIRSFDICLTIYAVKSRGRSVLAGTQSRGREREGTRARRERPGPPAAEAPRAARGDHQPAETASTGAWRAGSSRRPPVWNHAQQAHVQLVQPSRAA